MTIYCLIFRKLKLIYLNKFFNILTYSNYCELREIILDKSYLLFFDLV